MCQYEGVVGAEEGGRGVPAQQATVHLCQLRAQNSELSWQYQMLHITDPLAVLGLLSVKNIVASQVSRPVLEEHGSKRSRLQLK